MPSGVEQYGQTVGLDKTTLARIKTGFDSIREYAGWENFCIPSYVWDYVDQAERDRILAYANQMIYEERSDGWWDSAENKPLHLVVWYQAALWIEWRKSDTEFASAGSETIFDKWVADSGLTEEADIDKTYYSSPEFNTYADIFFPWVAEPGPYLYLDIWVDPPASLWNGAYLYDNYGNRLLYSTDALSETDNYLYDSVFDYRKTYIEDWDDIGVLAEGWPNPLLINGEYEALSGRATFKSFGLMDGSVETTESLEEGSQVQVARGGDILFTGIVTEARVSLVDGVYSVSVSDPVTAGGGEVEYTSGNAISAMQEAIEACGGTFETEIETEETVVYIEEKVDAWQFFRAVSYAVGGVLQYGRDGVYRLVEGGSGHSVTDSMIIGDDRPTIEERTKDYANRVAATIDEEWRTPAVENTIETFTSPGAGYAEITRFGEQIVSQEVNFSGGGQTTYTHDYDENGYCIKTIEEEEGAQEIGSMKRVRTLEFTDISEDGNEYKVSDVIETHNYGYSPISEENGWILIARTTLSWDVNLDGISFVEEIEQGTTPIGGGSVLLEVEEGESTVNLSVPLCSGYEVAWPELWNRRKWVASIVTSPVAGPIEGFTSCTEYSWTEVGINADPGSALGFCSRLGWYQLPSRSDKSYTVPKLEVYAPEDTHEVHILAKAEDPDAITALGEHEYECQAVSLDTETGMQAFALGVLFEKGRIRHANVSVANDDYLSGDSVIWRGLEWQIDTVTVDLDRRSDIIEMVTTSTLARLQNSISREPVSWIEDVKNVVTKRTGLYNNVSRGRILSQVGFRRYLVQAEGKATPVEAKALTDDPHLVGGSVLLVRPSGKGQPWTLLSLSKEQKIVMPELVKEKVTPDTRPAPPELVSFTADEYTVPIFTAASLSWEFAGDTGLYGVGVEIDAGDGREIITVLGGTEDFAPDLPNTELLFEEVGSCQPVATPFYTSLFGTRIYGEAVLLAEMLDIVGSAVTDVSVGTGDVVFGTPHQLVVTTDRCLTAEQGFVLLVNHGDGEGFVEYELEDAGDGTGIFEENYTWYITGLLTITAKMAAKQGSSYVWESVEETLQITVAGNLELEGEIISIGTEQYMSLPVGGDFLFDAPVAEFYPYLLNMGPRGTTLLRRNSEEPAYGVGGAFMKGLTISYTLHGKNVAPGSGAGAHLYLEAPQQWHTTLECGDGYPTEYPGGYLNNFLATVWRISFYENDGDLRLWSGLMAIKANSNYWYNGYYERSTIMPMPSGEWDMDILLERIHTPGVPLYFANTLRLYINGDYIKDVGNGHVAWEAPMPNLDPEIAPRNVPHTWRGRGWQSIGKSTSTSLSIPGNVKLFIPQQLVQYDPALLPGGACEFKWLRSETDYDE